MGNFEKLSVLVIVVIIVMILVVALYTWQDNGDGTANSNVQPIDDTRANIVPDPDWPPGPSPDPDPIPDPLPDPEPLPEPDPLPAPNPDDVEKFEDPVNPTPEPAGPGDDPSVNETWNYVVKPGDTGGHIAMRELGTTKRVSEIEALNPGLNWTKIRPGDVLKMPARGIVGPKPAIDTPQAGPRTGGPVPGETYTSVAGDTVQSLAKRAYGGMDRWPELWARNLSVIPGIDRPFKPGTKIFIPR